MCLVNHNKVESTNKIKIYDLILSVGEACSCTESLRAINLQEFSYPLDWIFGASFLERINIVASEFKNFLNKEDLIYTGTQEIIPKDIYKNVKNGLSFNHDFPKNVPFDESYNEVKEKYDRRINRLLEKINASQKVLFVYLELPTRQDSPDLDNTLLVAQETLAKAFPTTKCDILYIKHDAQLEVNNYIYENVSDRILKIKLNNKSPNPNDVDYAINVNSTINIFKIYLLNKTKINLDILDAILT